MAFAINLEAQSIGQLERKAKKTFNREAYSMTLYYSQAILRLDQEHAKALKWSRKSSEALNMFGYADGLPYEVSATTYAIAFPDKKVKNSSPPISNPILVVSTYNALDSNVLNGTYIGITNDGFGKGDFYQNTEEANRAVFEIPDTQFYTITATKNMFTAGFTTLAIENRPDTIYTELYLKPAWNLPLHLYFDHGKPSANSSADSMTNLTYEDVWLDYLYRINDYIDNNKNTDRAQAQTEVGRFFNYHLDANYHQLELVCQQLESHLKSGMGISLILESSYHSAEKGEETDALISRRFNSIENYFSFYKNGILKPSMANGHLKIRRKVFKINMEEEMENGISPFDIEVAKTRKVVIKMGEMKND